MGVDFQSHPMARGGLADRVEVKPVGDPAPILRPVGCPMILTLGCSIARIRRFVTRSVFLLRRIVDGRHNEIKALEDLVWIIQFSIGTDAELHAMKDAYPARELLVQRSNLVPLPYNVFKLQASRPKPDRGR